MILFIHVVYYLFRIENPTHEPNSIFQKHIKYISLIWSILWVSTAERFKIEINSIGTSEGQLMPSIFWRIVYIILESFILLLALFRRFVLCVLFANSIWMWRNTSVTVHNFSYFFFCVQSHCLGKCRYSFYRNELTECSWIVTNTKNNESAYRLALAIWKLRFSWVCLCDYAKLVPFIVSIKLTQSSNENEMLLPPINTWRRRRWWRQRRLT